MKPPIVLVEGDDVIVFPTLEIGEDWLEPEDVDVPQTTVYDSDGRLLKIGVGVKEREGRSLFGKKWVKTYTWVVISEDNPSEDRSSELREALFEYLLYNTDDEDGLRELTLRDLVFRVGMFMPWRSMFKGVR